KPEEALEMHGRARIEHFDGVVAKRGNVEPLRRGIECEMIDSPLDSMQVDGPDERERFLSGSCVNRHQHQRKAGGRNAHEMSLSLSLTRSGSSPCRGQPHQRS